MSDYARSLAWYERLLGSSPSFLASPTEAVWELAEHRNVYIEERSSGVGHALITIFIDDFDEQLASIAARGLEPEQIETYDKGVRKATSLTQTATRSTSEEPLLGPSPSSPSAVVQELVLGCSTRPAGSTPGRQSACEPAECRDSHRWLRLHGLRPGR